jgi:nicotinate-nucleotide pyrophosphorylase (carboxylating)
VLDLESAFADVVERALAEDVGEGDVTTQSTVPVDARAHATITQKAPGVIFGLRGAERAFKQLDPDAVFLPRVAEGAWRDHGEVLTIQATAWAILTAERTALNILGRLSGVATATAIAVREVAGTKATILDTRKTTPGLRALEKAAVDAGGGRNHRFGLFDAVLIKENHITAAGGITAAVQAARGAHPGLLIEVECETRAEVDEALAAGATRLLLDNMTSAEMRDTVAHVGGRAELEASGGITMANLREVAETGVDYISLGALTHSAPALDVSLLVA